MPKYPRTLVEELIKKKILPEDGAAALRQEAEQSGKSVGELLVGKKTVEDAVLRKLKSELYGLPEADLSKAEVKKELSQEISDEVIKFYGIIPFEKADNILKVGILDPEDIDALEALKFIAEEKGLQLEKYVIGYADFRRLLQQFGSLKSEVSKVIKAISEESLSKKELDIAKDTGGIEQITAEAPVTKIVAVVVKFAVESRASDIHIEPFEDRIRVRFRVDGILQTVLTLPKDLLSAVVTRVKILSDLKIDETRLPQDGRFSTHLAERKIDFRVSILPTSAGEKVVMRILDPMAGDIDLPSLGFMGRNLEVLERNLAKPFGQILITGPTGSGKSTTLYAMLRKLNEEGVNITTLEDPIEYFLDGINQSQVHEEINFTFSNGLRSILRQDPDIVMVGEIRDKETAGLATQAALTGHIVLSTLHTNDSIGVVPRLIDMEVPKYLIAPTLNAAVGQRLLRRLCPDCKEESKPNSAEEKIIEEALSRFPEAAKGEIPKERKFFKPSKQGCKTCGGKSFKGRVAVVEVLEMTDELEAVILGNISESGMRREAARQGMISIFQDGILKVLNGTTSLEELLQVAQEAQDDAEDGKEKAK